MLSWLPTRVHEYDSYQAKLCPERSFSAPHHGLELVSLGEDYEINSLCVTYVDGSASVAARSDDYRLSAGKGVLYRLNLGAVALGNNKLKFKHERVLWLLAAPA